MSAEAKLSEAALEIQRRLNRDLNCLTDENRGTRRSALNKLKRVFFSARAVRACVWVAVAVGRGVGGWAVWLVWGWWCG